MLNTLRRGRKPHAFIRVGALILLSASYLACSDPARPSEFDGDATLTTEIQPPVTSLTPGMHELELDSLRDGRLYIPASYDHDVPTPVVLLLHGATGSGNGIATAFQALADSTGVVLLAPDSRQASWDLIIHDFGPDVAFIDIALTWATQRVNIDPNHLTIAGFSDGATYALSLGLSNGNLFKKVIAFSPGFVLVKKSQGKPPVFITHGIDDPILPIETASRSIVPALEQAGYTVEYHEFPGGHMVLQSLAEDAFEWAIAP
jgi:phospholipase/carboxylesterase